MSFNPRLARLAVEYTKLMNLAGRSRFIKIEPVEMQPGWPPEKYVVTYTCKGVAGIDGDQNPISSNFHQVQVYMGRDYPQQEPSLRWLTPIWHPNIQHEEPHRVCTNDAATWYAAKSLVDLVVVMGEMVQYKRYLAKWEYPYPLDQIAADWVVNYAEPKGILGPQTPWDRRPLVQQRRMRNEKQPELPRPEIGGIGWGKREKKEEAAPAAGAVGSRIKWGNRSPQQAVAQETPAPAAADPAPDAAPAAPEGGEDFLLEVSRGGSTVSVTRMSKPVFTIGRGGEGVEVDLALEGDESVSVLHALLVRVNRSLWLTAKGETPVRVDGEALPREEMTLVAASAQIEIGDFSLRLK